jgi:sugar phosphate isomerase/epimerase
MTLAAQPLTLSAGSMVRYSFSDFVDAASAAGFAAISVTKRLRHLARQREDLTLADMRAMIGERGLRVAEVEGTPGWRRGPARPDDGRVLGFEEALELATGLRATGVVAYHDERPGGSPGELAEDFAAACDRAAAADLTLALEFLPWTPVPTLSDALAIAEAAGRPNGGVVLDAWHHAHGGQRSLALTPGQAALISCFQLDDARSPQTDELVHETMFGRRVPGTGVLDLRALVAGLDAAGVDCPVAVEAYDETLAGLSAREYAGVLATAARHTLSPPR